MPEIAMDVCLPASCRDFDLHGFLKTSKCVCGWEMSRVCMSVFVWSGTCLCVCVCGGGGYVCVCQCLCGQARVCGGGGTCVYVTVWSGVGGRGEWMLRVCGC